MAVHCLVFLVGLRREEERILALRDLAAAPEIFARAETLWLTSELTIWRIWWIRLCPA